MQNRSGSSGENQPAGSNPQATVGSSLVVSPPSCTLYEGALTLQSIMRRRAIANSGSREFGEGEGDLVFATREMKAIRLKFQFIKETLFVCHIVL